jgi:hypothetical protein
LLVSFLVPYKLLSQALLQTNILFFATFPVPSLEENRKKIFSINQNNKKHEHYQNTRKSVTEITLKGGVDSRELTVIFLLEKMHHVIDGRLEICVFGVYHQSHLKHFKEIK